MNEKDFKRIYLKSVDSTNDWCRRNIADLQLPACVIADFQESGKGQYLRKWISESGENLLCSVVFKPDGLDAYKGFYISKAIAISLAEILQNYIPDVLIKWPNDILIKQRKIAGILIENSISGALLRHSVAGTGLNLNQDIFPEFTNTTAATSLYLETGKFFSRDEVLENYLNKLSAWLKVLDQEDFELIDQKYNSLLMNFNKWADYSKGDHRFRGKIRMVGPDGHLLLMHESGELKSYAFNEVSYILG